MALSFAQIQCKLDRCLSLLFGQIYCFHFERFVIFPVVVLLTGKHCTNKKAGPHNLKEHVGVHSQAGACKVT